MIEEIYSCYRFNSNLFMYVMSQTYYFVHCMLCLIMNQKIKWKSWTLLLVSCDKLTLVSLICDAHEINIQRQTSVISNFLDIEVFTQVHGLRYIRVLLYFNMIFRNLHCIEHIFCNILKYRLEDKDMFSIANKFLLPTENLGSKSQYPLPFACNDTLNF